MVAIKVNCLNSATRGAEPIIEEMVSDWGGLETLLAAAEFVESQEQNKSDKLIEICEWPSSEKKLSLESASFLPPAPCVPMAVRSPALIQKVMSKNIEIAGLNSSRPGVTSTKKPSFTNDAPSSSTLISTIPLFSPSSSFTLAFAAPSAVNQTAALLTSSSTAIRQSTVMMATQPFSTNDHVINSLSSTSNNTITSQLGTSSVPLSQNIGSTSSPLPHRTQSDKFSIGTEARRKSSYGTKEVHNKLEKNRRAHLKDCFEMLKGQVPAIQDARKPSNLTILRTAIRYVQILRRREQDLESEMERLAREKIAHQQRWTTLKKELSAQWDHIDFNSLLPESLESIKAAGRPENGKYYEKNYDREKNADEAALSDIDDNSSHLKGDTYYGSSSPIGSCSVSSLHISSPAITTVSDTLPPQIHIVESPAVFDDPSNATVVNPLHFLSSSTLRIITDPEQPVTTLVPHNEGEPISTAFLTTTNMGDLVNHSFVMTQPSSGQMLISTTSSHLHTNPPALIKSVSHLQPPKWSSADDETSCNSNDRCEFVKGYIQVK